ncbi:MAG: hypothetical protein H6733_12090 [Alphaproteobacteria bacterium]|nr:hypothetical protein [Alphaproteobacteria bacterium]
MAHDDTELDRGYEDEAPAGFFHSIQIRIQEVLGDDDVDRDRLMQGSISVAIASGVVAVVVMLLLVVLAPSGGDEADQRHAYGDSEQLRDVRAEHHEVYVDADPYAGGSGGGGGGGVRGGAGGGDLSYGGAACVVQADGAPMRLIDAVRRTSGFGLVTGWHGQPGVEPCSK